MKVKQVLFFVLCLVQVGCIQSLHPYYTEDDVYFDEGLIGSWDEGEWNVAKGDEPNVYEVRMTEGDGKEFYKGVLFKIEGESYMDFRGGAEPESKNFVAVHTAAKLDIKEDKVVVRFLNRDKIKEMLMERPGLLEHEIIDGEVLLTDETENLQRFIRDYGALEEFYMEGHTLEKDKE